MTNPQERASDQLTERNQLLLIAHGTLGVFMGLIFGLFLMFNVLGSVDIWPLVSIKAQVPGSSAAWRAAHVGPILNGILCIGAGLALPKIPMSLKAQRFVTSSLIFMVWANINFYVFSIFGKAHGLTGGYTERFGQANVFDAIALLPAMVAVLLTPITMIVMARAALRHRTALYEIR